MSTTLINRLLPIPQVSLRIPLQIVLGVAFLALLSQFSIHIGPVPITGQTLGVLLIGAVYGSSLAGITVLSYLLLGGMGLGIFSAGAAGWGVFSGATAGYLIGFVPAAILVGYLAERGWDRAFSRIALAMVLGNLVIYALGLLWLHNVLGNWQTTLQAGLYPFLIGDAIKIVIAAILLPWCWQLLGKEDSRTESDTSAR